MKTDTGESTLLTNQTITMNIRVTGHTMLSSACDDFMTMVMGKMQRLTRPLHSHWLEFDKQIGGGLDQGMLVTIAGRTGSGKSAFVGELLHAFRTIEKNWSRKPMVLHFTMEMSTNQLLMRHVQRCTGLPSDKLRGIGGMQLTKDEFAEVEAAIAKWRDVGKPGKYVYAYQDMRDNKNNLVLDKNGEPEKQPLYKSKANEREVHYFVDSLQVGDIYNTITQYQESPLYEGYLIIVVIDHVLLVSGLSDIRHTLQDLEKALIELRKKKHTLILQVAQMNRDIEYHSERTKRGQDRIPRLSDIAESDAIAHASDLILFMDRPEQRGINYFPQYKCLPDEDDDWNGYMGAKGKLLVHVMKNRDGHCGTYLFKHDFSHMKLEYIKSLNKW